MTLALAWLNLRDTYNMTHVHNNIKSKNVWGDDDPLKMTVVTWLPPQNKTLTTYY